MIEMRYRKIRTVRRIILGNGVRPEQGHARESRNRRDRQRFIRQAEQPVLLRTHSHFLPLFGVNRTLAAHRYAVQLFILGAEVGKD